MTSFTENVVCEGSLLNAFQTKMWHYDLDKFRVITSYFYVENINLCRKMVFAPRSFYNLFGH